jgi:phosphohistidine swiveling domain-containing protein
MTSLFNLLAHSRHESIPVGLGGKARGLAALQTQKMPVPPWWALDQSACQEYLAHGLGAQIQAIMDQLDTLGARECSTRIATLFENNSLSLEQRQAYLPQGLGPWAVRSSAVDEDSATHSFAGQHTTLLDQSSEQLEQALLKVWASAWSERALSYRRQHGLEMPLWGTGVVFQLQIHSEWSGVLFNCDPVLGHSAHWVLHSIQGLGEAYVSGDQSPEEFHLHPKNGTVLHYVAPTQDRKCVGPDQWEKIVNPLPLPEVARQKLWELCANWCTKHPGAWDFEWAYAKGETYLLQARPVSTWVEKPGATLFLWDNSNIVESYGGLTLPLTFSFASRMYHAVYVQFCKLLGIGPRGLREMESTLRNMLGHIDGRVYYNLFHWYRLTGLLPFYGANRSFMETMMGTSQALEDELAERVRPPAGMAQPSLWQRFWTGLHFLRGHLTIQSQVDRFLSWFHHHYQKALELPIDQMSVNEALSAYENLENRFAHSWQVPILNDFLCMVHFGMFSKTCLKWFPDHPNLHNDLLAGQGNLESAEPTRAFLRIAERIRQTPELCLQIQTRTDQACVVHFLEQGQGPEWLERALKDYLAKFGFRCMSEMKLEQPDLHQEPSQLFAFLRNLLHPRTPTVAELEKREQNLRQGAETVVTQRHLTWVQSRWMKWTTFHARRAVMNRENTRFCRTRIYGIARRIFVKIGQELYSRQKINSPKDIFYLELTELRGLIEGTNSLFNPIPLIDQRKLDYAQWEKQELPRRFWTRGPVAWSPRISAEQQINVTLEPGTLQGQGCCPGTVEGVVKVVIDPTDDLKLDGEILVTERTDPGWIPLYPAISALLIGRGGLLSHSAIVAREMGLPTIVNIPNLCQTLRTGMKVRIDGSSGRIQILNEENL